MSEEEMKEIRLLTEALNGAKMTLASIATVVENACKRLDKFEEVIEKLTELLNKHEVVIRVFEEKISQEERYNLAHVEKDKEDKKEIAEASAKVARDAAEALAKITKENADKEGRRWAITLATYASILSAFLGWVAWFAVTMIKHVLIK